MNTLNQKKWFFLHQTRPLCAQILGCWTTLLFRARPVGAGIPVMGCVGQVRTWFRASLNTYRTESVEGSTPLNKYCDSKSQCIERGSRWLAFLLPKEKWCAP